MATIQKRGDKYRAIVRKRGYTQTATFTRRRDAEAWAREVEVAIENGTLEAYDKLSFGDVLRRYLAEVTPTKKSARGKSCAWKRFYAISPFSRRGQWKSFRVAMWRSGVTGDGCRSAMEASTVSGIRYRRHGRTPRGCGVWRYRRTLSAWSPVLPLPHLAISASAPRSRKPSLRRWVMTASAHRSSSARR